MTAHIHLRCTVCGAQYSPDYPPDVCPNHSGLEGILEVCYELQPDMLAQDAEIAKSASQVPDTLARYISMLPLDSSSLKVLPGGWLTRTPLIDAPLMASELGVASMRIKDEGRNPTGSLKDRSSTLAALHATKLGLHDICCASTGNAASSLAGICANLGLHAHIFVPETTPQAKLDQLRVFGANVMLVRGTYDDAYYLSRDVAKEFGWYDRNCATNPYLVEGKKTCGLELAEQLAEEGADWVSVAVGDGCTVTAIHKGLREMVEIGMISEIPRILAIQPEGAAPIVAASRAGTYEIEPIIPSSGADSISVGRPRNARRALDAVRDSGGQFVSVSDEQMMYWRARMAGTSGVFAEMGAAAGVAGVAAAREIGIIGADSRVVHVATGNGLKDAGRLTTDQDAAFEVVDADIMSVRHALERVSDSVDGTV